MFLIFVKPADIDYQGKKVYEFIFSEFPEAAWDESWAGNFPEPPSAEHIAEVAVVKTEEITILTYYKHFNFNMFDVQDGVIPLAYEEIEYDVEDDIFIKKRMIFPYKMTKEEFIRTIKERGLKIEWTN